MAPARRSGAAVPVRRRRGSHLRWRTVGPKVAGLPNLSVVQIPHAPVQQLAQTVDRRVSAQVMVMEGQVTMTVGDVDVTFTPEPME
ncbi:MAG: YaeQ family protein [Mycobacterium sp.]|nr:YaeQ family protein [Mycobacterium sp.]